MVKFPTPAWSSTNLLNIAKFVESGLVFAHVRAASDGAVLVGSVNHENTHPFQVRHAARRFLLSLAFCSLVPPCSGPLLFVCTVLFGVSKSSNVVHASKCNRCCACCVRKNFGVRWCRVVAASAVCVSPKACARSPSGDRRA